MTELMKILGKSYEKLNKILTKTYDQNLVILNRPFRSTNTNKYLVLCKTRTKGVYKCTKVYKCSIQHPCRIQREINNGMCCYLTPSKVTAAVNGHIIHIFQVELTM